jgi:hypothetical protein
MAKNDWKKQIAELIALVGEEKAVALLISAEASPSIAEKMVANRYTSKPGRLVCSAIRKALEMAAQQAS